jgi:hypothetical protein
MKATFYSPLLLLALSSCLILFVHANGGGSEEQCNPLVVPLFERVAGKTYSEWAAEWWQYILGLPTYANPAFDTTGHLCNVAQDGPVFFLAGYFGGSSVTRQCTIKGSKYFFFPLINVECSNIESPPFFGATPCDRRACANVNIDTVNATSLKVKVDNQYVKHPRNYRVQSPDFEFSMPPHNNTLGVDNVIYGYSTAAGYYLMLRPLSTGWHQIRWEGCLLDGSFCQNIVYNLNIIP